MKHILIMIFLGMVVSAGSAQAYVCEINNGDPWWALSPNPPTPEQAAAAAAAVAAGQKPEPPPTGAKFNEILQIPYLEDDLFGALIVDEWWSEYMLPALQNMTNQINSVQTYMTGVQGGLIDGLMSNTAQRTQQVREAEAVRDYTPGENLCRFGTNVRALAQSEHKALISQIALSEMAENRWLATKGGSSEQTGMDRIGRFQQFQRLYCNPGDNNGRMRELCGADPKSIPARFNKDIDFTRTIAAPHTLDLDFTDGQLTADEEDVNALAANLYGHDVFGVIRHFPVVQGKIDEDHEIAYLDLRQLVALRSVAQNSFNAQVALRAKGAKGGAQFLRNALREMGMSDEEARQYLDAETNAPSYFAQMEILTRKLYQNPNFYVNLVDKPANVDRQIASMRAFDLMQNRDIVQSLQRQEMLMSLLVELEVREEQVRVQSDLDGRSAPKGRSN